jgi:hypothetical protein
MSGRHRLCKDELDVAKAPPPAVLAAPHID